MVSVSLDDIRLLLKAGATRTIYGIVNKKWRVEVDLYGHVFVYEDDYYFAVSAPSSGRLFL